MTRVPTNVFNSAAFPLFITLQEQGFEFQVTGGALFIKPVDRVTKELRVKLRQHKPTLITLVRVWDQGVQDRVEVFRAQLEADPTTIGPFLFTAGVPYSKGICFSCGAGLPDACFGRCSRCSLAWRLAYRLPVPAELGAAHDEARVLA